MANFRGDTLDLVLLAAVRCGCLLVLVPLTLAIGIDSGPKGLLPHEQTEAQLAKTERAGRLRVALLILIFVVGSASSVYAGIKCIMYDFDGGGAAALASGDAQRLETYMAPFLLLDIAIVNLQFSCVKRLVKSYVMQVGLIETGLHLHPLKFYPGWCCSLSSIDASAAPRVASAEIN